MQRRMTLEAAHLDRALIAARTDHATSFASGAVVSGGRGMNGRQSRPCILQEREEHVACAPGSSSTFRPCVSSSPLLTSPRAPSRRRKRCCDRYDGACDENAKGVGKPAIRHRTTRSGRIANNCATAKFRPLSMIEIR